MLFSVLRMPAMLNSRNIVRMVGLSTLAPEQGLCETTDYALTETESTTGVQHVEMLDVGDVSLLGEKGASALTRQAFPTVTDFIAGVVYTTRDPSAAPPPLSPSYVLSARGAPGILPFKIPVDVPKELTGIQIDNSRLEQVSRLARGQALTVTWQPGAPGDKFEIQVWHSEQSTEFSCVFSDAAGAAELTPDALGTAGTVRLTFHRLRSANAEIRGIDRTQVEVDFSVDHLVEVVEEQP